MPGLSDDPFDWDTDRLAKELYSPGRKWLPQKPKKFPPLDEFPKALEDNDIDGELFLTYGKTHAEYRDLWADLGVDKPQYRLHLNRAIDTLRLGSNKYKELSRSDAQENDEQDHASLVNGSSEHGQTQAQRNGADQPDDTVPTEPQTRPMDELKSIFSSSNEQASTKRKAEDGSAPEDDGRPGSDEPTSKKRRIVPVVVDDYVLVKPSRHRIPTEADVIEGWANGPSTDPSSGPTTWSHAYLGPHALNWGDVLQGDDRPVDEPFQFMANTQQFEHGHALRVNRAMKSLLRRDAMQLQSMMKKFDKPVEPDSFLDLLMAEINPRDPGMREPTPEDPVLGVYGEEDGDSDLDPDTLREMEEEQAEEERRKATQPRTLCDDDVAVALDAAIGGIVAKWTEQKIPILDRKAHGLWTKTRRLGTRMLELRKAASTLEAATAQIETGRREIQKLKWTSAGDIERQVLSLEQSIINRENARWAMDTLNGPMPPKPEMLPRAPRPVRREQPLIGEDEELLTSASEAEDDDMTGFIDDEVQPEPVPASPAFRRPKLEARRTPDNFVDLTQEEAPAVTPEKPKPAPEVIDLITPDPVRSYKVVPGFSGRVPPQTVWERMPGWTVETVQQRLLICMLWQLKKSRRTDLYEAARNCEQFPNTFWEQYIVAGIELPAEGEPELVSHLSTRLFESYVSKKALRPRSRRLRKLARSPGVIENHQAMFSRFFDIVICTVPRFPETNVDIEDGYALEFSEEEREESVGGSQSKPKKRTVAAAAPVVLDQTAVQMREGDMRRIQEQEKRRNELRQQISRYQTVSRDKSRLIVNETKKEGEGFVYITGEPARLIKDHQIDGVRFMWNHIVAGSVKNPQGCVLAHTMGLGKTMQVITFLMAVVEAAQSHDPSVQGQIPKHLRKSRTLILCPPTLMLNWRDELLQWDRERTLGEIRLVGSNPKADAPDAAMARATHISKWGAQGGVLIVGYKLFPRLLAQEMEGNILTRKPNIVVADEAHTIKNVASKIRTACTKFVTRSRIALTGSPLSNNVTEYYSMIDWIAPHYMGPHSEFDDMYTKPIETGLWKDCTRSETRKAHVLLHVLRKTISPKVHRATIQALKGDFPAKREFVLSIPTTRLQKKLYNQYVDLVHGSGDSKAQMTWGVLGNLQLILNHPRCFAEKVAEVILGNGSRRGVGSGEDGGEDSAAVEEAALPLAWAKQLKLAMASVRDPLDPEHSWRVKHLVHILDASQKAGDKVLIFSQRLKTLDFLENLCRQQKRPCYRLDGQTKLETRVPMISQFNLSNDTGVFLVSTKAGGVGLNIHSANRVVIMDFSHNPMHEQQAIGRAYRIGQLKPVYVYWFVASGTFEEKLQGRSVFKRQLADRVVDDMKFKAAGELDTEGWIRHVVEDKDRWEDEDEPQPDIGEELGKDHVLDGIIEARKGVTKVITTDTFQIEMDPDEVKLTAEESKEVEFMLEKEQSRHGVNTVTAMQPQPQLEAQAQTHSQPPFTITSTPQALPQSQMMLGAASNPHAPSMAPPAPAPSTPRRQPHVFRQGVFVGDVETWEPGQNGDRPRGCELYMPEASSCQTQMLLNQDAHNQSMSFISFRNALGVIMDKFDWYALHSHDLVRGGRPPSIVQYCETAATQISRERRETQNVTQSQHDRHYQMLQDCATSCPRIVEAFVCQAVSISFLASAKEPEVRNLTRQLSQMDEAQFIDYIKSRRARLEDPPHLPTALNRRNRERLEESITPQRETTRRKKDDELILREVADRRKKRLASSDKKPLRQLTDDTARNVPGRALSVPVGVPVGPGETSPSSSQHRPNLTRISTSPLTMRRHRMAHQHQ